MSYRNVSVFIMIVLFSLANQAAANDHLSRRAAELRTAPHGHQYAPGEILVKFHDGVSETTRGRLHATARAVSKRRFRSLGIDHLQLPSNLSVDDAVAFYSSDPNVEYAEPNYRRYATATVPDDTGFGELWGLDNIGQIVNGTAGTADADIDAPEAWDITSGSSAVVIAVIDTGVAWEHPDLAANIWTNAVEATGLPGVDDDGNGYIDDVRGWDFVDGDNDPTSFDDPGHGTHVAGTIGAVGNNMSGVTGVMWTVKIMPLRFLDTLGSGLVSDEILAINYAIDNGAKIINASFGSSSSSDSEQAAIAAADAAGILFVAAAGNSGTDTDSSPHYPSSYPLANIIAVAATDQNDALASFSNFGTSSVDVGAPGVNTFSTVAARTTIFSDDFESGIGNWTVGKDAGTIDWGLTTPISASPVTSLADSPAGEYENDADTFARLTSAENLTGEIGCRWDYALRLATEFNSDFFEVERSTDAVSWTQLPSASYSGSTGGSFFLFAEDLTVMDGLPSVYARFRLTTDGSDTRDGAYVDDVSLNCASSTYTDPVTELDFLQGTSMATPHVTGIAGLVASIDPTFSNADIKKAILNMVDPKASLSGLVLTGGRVNAYGALLYATGADLSIVKVGGPDPVVASNNVTYTLTVTNQGLSAATNVVVTDPLPGSVTFVSATASQGTCSGTVLITCTIGSLANGASATITLVVTADVAGTLNNTASVSSDVSDPIATDNSVTFTIIVKVPPSGGGCGNIGPPSGPMSALRLLSAVALPLLVALLRRQAKKWRRPAFVV